jgi:hypothetical protein
VSPVTRATLNPKPTNRWLGKLNSPDHHKPHLKRIEEMIRYTAKTLAVVAIVFGWLLVTGAALAQDSTKTPTYIGGSKCKMCHKGEKNGNMWEIWEGSTHAKSLQTLIDKGEQNNAECLACHTTGHGVAGGYGTAGMEAPEALGSVSCEACHGPGSEYKSKKVMEDHAASVAAGLWIPDENTCKKCHNEKSPTFKGFNFAEAWAKIKHETPAVADSAAAPAGGSN